MQKLAQELSNETSRMEGVCQEALEALASVLFWDPVDLSLEKLKRDPDYAPTHADIHKYDNMDIEIIDDLDDSPDGTIAASEDTAQPKGSLAEYYRGYLNEEGYDASIDEDGHVTFNLSDGLYGIVINEGDEGYFRLAHPGFWKIESNKERTLALSACAEAARRKKVAKVFMNEARTYVNAAAEGFFASREDIAKLFPRYLSDIKAAVSDFRKAMSKA